MPLILSIHMVTAGLVLLSGAVALSAAKGGWLHRRSGILFVYSLVVTCASATVVAAATGHVANLIVAAFAAYLVVTAWSTVQPLTRWLRRLDQALMLFAFALGLASVVFAFEAVVSPTGTTFGIPAFPFFLFAAIGVGGGAGDFRMLPAGRLRGLPRLKRHLWRMCSALLIGTISFFPNHARVARVLPYPFTTPALRMLPIVLVLAATVYWLWRVRSGRQRDRERKDRDGAPGSQRPRGLPGIAIGPAA